MVDYFVGTITETSDQEIVVDLGIVGVTLQVPCGQLFEKGTSQKIYTLMHWNSENGPSMFGFSSPTDRTIFKIVIGCSGIGPKIALSILADMGAQNFLTAVTTGDDNLLSKVNGIGKKKAEQIIVQLKHKVTRLVESGTISEITQDVAHINDVLQALQSLNYSRPEINRAMDYVKKNVKMHEVSFDYLLRQALAYLAQR